MSPTPLADPLSPEELRTRLDETVLRSLNPVFAWLAALHVVFALLDPVLVSSSFGRLSSQGYWAIVCVVTFAGLRWIVARESLAPRWSHPITALAAFVVSGRVIDTVRLGWSVTAIADPALFVVGVGCVVLSRIWLFAIAGAVLAAWLVAAQAFDPKWVLSTQALYQLFAAATLSALIHEVRLKTYTRFIAANAELARLRESDRRRLQAESRLTATLLANEAQLKRHNQLIEWILKSMPIVAFRLDANGAIVEAVGAGLTRTGLGSDLVGRDALDLFPHAAEPVRRALAGGSERFDLEGVGPAGRWIFDCFLTFDRVENGGVIGIATDITERTLAEEERRRADELLHELARFSGAVIFIKDLQGRYIYISRRYEKLFHVTNDEMFGKTDYDLFPADVAAALQANDRQVVADDEPLTREEQVPNDGEMRDYLSIKFPLRNRDETVRAVCGIATDITDKKKAEAELRRRETAIRRFAEVGIVGVIVGDFEGRITDANDAFLRMVGYEKSDLATLRWDEMTPREHREKDLLAISQMQQAGVCEPYEKEYLRKDGTRLPILIGAGLLDDVGQAVVCFVLDYSEQKRAEQKIREMAEQLDQATRIGLLGEMTTGIAHELRQPLAVISTYAQAAGRRLARRALSREKAKSYFEEFSRQAMRAGDVIDHVRRLIKKHEAVRRPTDVNEVISSALRLVRLSARDSDVALEFSKGTDLPRIEADAVLLSQVVINLAMNAIQALAEVRDRPRRVEIRSLATQDGGVEIIVQDNGPGLPEDIRDNLFRQFVTTKPNGLGLGLAMAKSVVDLHGGELWTSTPAGGCAFHVTLPPSPQEQRFQPFHDSLSDEELPTSADGESPGDDPWDDDFAPSAVADE